MGDAFALDWLVGWTMLELNSTHFEFEADVYMDPISFFVCF